MYNNIEHVIYSTKNTTHLIKAKCNKEDIILKDTNFTILMIVFVFP